MDIAFSIRRHVAEDTMVSKNGMTIRDYLARHTLSKDLLKRWSAALKGPRDGTDPFARLLQSNLSHSARKVNRADAGLTAADYLANPIPARVYAGQVPRDDPRPSISCDSAHLTNNSPSARSPLSPSPISRFPASRDDQISPTSDRPGKNNGIHADPGEKETIDKCIQEAAQKYGLAPQLIEAVIRAESGFRVDAVSVAGAQGLMQLMPATAKDLGVTNPFDIRQNIDGGARYLRQMFDLFDGDARLALSAYNAGPGNVQKYGGDVPFPETRRYVARVLASVRDFT
jgi:soluble lytic murein transglycosylase-like protein